MSKLYYIACAITGLTIGITVGINVFPFNDIKESCNSVNQEQSSLNSRINDITGGSPPDSRVTTNPGTKITIPVIHGPSSGPGPGGEVRDRGEVIELPEFTDEQKQFIDSIDNETIQ